jgi:hypothetical protein
MFKTSFLILSILFAFNIHAYPLVPNPILTTGELCSVAHSDFSEFRYHEQIPYCIRKVEKSLKDEIYDDYNIPPECRKRYTIDHLIPLALGGDNSKQNLWPEHKLVKATRMDLEYKLFLAMKDGSLTQSDSIEIIIKEKTQALKLLTNDKTLDYCDRVQNNIL